MTTKLEQHRIDHIKLGLNGWIYGAGEAPLTESNNLLYFNYDTSDFGVINNQLYIKDTGIDHNSLTNTHNLTSDIDHGSISGLSDDDHLQYTLRSDWLQNGFIDRDLSILSFDDGTRTLSIQPTGDDFDYFYLGVRYTSTGDTFQIEDTEGTHYIYYEEDTLVEIVNPTDAQISDIWLTKTPVSVIYWDSSESEAIYVGEERHGASMSPATHSYEHFNEGLRYRGGLGLTNILADDSGQDNEDAQFGVDAGAVQDEDIYESISAVGSITGLPIYYMTGASADWNRYINSGFSVRTYDGTSSTRLAWNEYTGGAWQLTEANTVWYILCHVFATTEKDNPLIAIMGQNEYSTVPTARDGAETEVRSLVLTNLPLPEIRPIASVIFQTSSTFNNDVKARIRSADTNVDYVDWRDEYISRVAVSSSDHGSLTGLTDSDDHTQYALLAGRSGGQTLIGGIAAGDDLTLQSTSNATKGSILFGTSAYDEVNNNLGIGTNSPSTTLDVNGDISCDDLFLGNNSSSGVIRHSDNNNALTLAGGNGSGNGANIELYGGAHSSVANNAYYDANKHTWRTQASSTKMALDTSTGYLGIGTSNPSNLLHIQDSSSATIRIQDTTNDAYTLLTQGDVNFNINNTYNGNMTFSTNNTEYMRLTSTGSLGLGGETSPDSTLSVKGGCAIGTTFAGGTGAGSDNLAVEGKIGIGKAPSSYPLEIDLSTADLGIVDSANSGTAGSYSEDGYIEIDIGGNTRYIRVYGLV